MKCPSCHGYGEYVEEYIDNFPRTEACGYCQGTGSIKNRRFYFRVLGWLSGEARRKKIKWKNYCVNTDGYRLIGIDIATSSPSSTGLTIMEKHW